jgi:hypothetical protein
MRRERWRRKPTEDRRSKIEDRGSQAVDPLSSNVGPPSSILRLQKTARPLSFALRRKALRLLRRRPLLMLCAIVMALAAGAVTVASAAGL